METNLAAWMIAGGPKIELEATRRNREQLHALLENRAANHVRLVDRILGRIHPKAEIDLVCCPA
jgi:hypothetical protein